MKKYEDALKELEKYKFHELCLMFPLLPEEEIIELAEDILKNGLLNPILLYKDEEILDGRNRLLGCIIAGIDPIYRRITSDIEAISIVIAENFRRRHQTPAEKSELGLKLYETQNENKEEIDDPNLKKLSDLAENKKIAKKIGSTAGTVKKVRKILEEAKKDPEVKKHFEKAKRGRVSIDTVYKKITEKKEKRPELIKVPKAKENIELRQEIVELKEENATLKAEKKEISLQIQHYKDLYEDVKRIAKEFGCWEKILSVLIPTVEKKDMFPSVKQLREAELL